jgi:hypothetical protein
MSLKTIKAFFPTCQCWAGFTFVYRLFFVGSLGIMGIAIKNIFVYSTEMDLGRSPHHHLTPLKKN